MNKKWDARYFQIIFQCTFLSYGILYLGWEANWLLYTVYIATALATQFIGDSIIAKKPQAILGKNSFLLKGGLSALISAASLCLLLKTNHLYTAAFASMISIASKYILRINGKHIFNPSAFGIVLMIYCTNDAWLLPAQWGFNTTIFFMVATLGTIVITKVQKLDVCLSFLFTFLGLLFYRQVIFLQWPVDFFWQSMSTGSLLLFTFFMISDPKTAPNHCLARMLWGIAIGILSYYLTVYKFVNASPIKALVLLAPLVPILDYLFKNKELVWFEKIKSRLTIPTIHIPQLGKKIATLFLIILLINNDLLSYCGCFVERSPIDTRYVGNADGTIKNKTSQVIMVRDGNKSVLTMYNDFKGNAKDFAMIVPVPTILKKSAIKVVSQNIFTTLNEYSKPKLLQFFDQNPCNKMEIERDNRSLTESVSVTSNNKMDNAIVPNVKVEAEYVVGEYDIVILSANESDALKTWLTTNGYKLPKGAEEALEPYVKSKLKFFVAKVNVKQLGLTNFNFLSPIQITFRSPKFMLPIRLGMANADGDQDMIVYAFTKKGRVECTNYRTVNMPTDKKVPLFVNQNFGVFYSNLFKHQWNNEGQNVAMLEYAWNVSPYNYSPKCNPCQTSIPNYNDLKQAGVWWMPGKDWNDYSDAEEEEEEDYTTSNDVYFTRLHIRYNRKNFAQDLNFMLTPNKEQFQTTYTITHPATGSFDCEAAKKYLTTLKNRRKEELQNLKSLTGKSYDNWNIAYQINDKMDNANFKDASYAMLSKNSATNNKTPFRHLPYALGVLGLSAIIYIKQKSIFNI